MTPLKSDYALDLERNICEALGLDPSTVSSLVMRFSHDHRPTVEIHRRMVEDGTLVGTIAEYELVPKIDRDTTP